MLNSVKRIFAILLSLALCVGAIPTIALAADSDTSSGLTITVSGSTFTVTRSDTSSAETFYYRTVDESAVSGIHYVGLSGDLSFQSGDDSIAVTVNEYDAAVVNGADRYTYNRYNNIGRTYRFEICAENDAIVSAQRTISYDGYHFSKKDYFTKEYGQIFSSQIDVDDRGYDQAVYNYNLDDFFDKIGTNPWDYLNSTNIPLYTRLTFTAWETIDCYEYVQILADNSETCDSGANKGDPGDINVSMYMAGFSITEESDKQQYAFPVINAGNNCSRITDAWGSTKYYNLGNTIGDLVTQKFQSDDIYTSDCKYLIVPTDTKTLNYRFNASGSWGDKWSLSGPYTKLIMSDTTKPTVTDLYAPTGDHTLGEYTTFSVRFSEIVNIDENDLPSITTDCGTFDYVGGSGTNVLYFGGYVDYSGDNQTTITMSAISGTLTDMAGNKLNASALPLSDDFTVTSSKPLSGSGTESDPYIITTREELYWFANYVNAGNSTACAKLGADIDATVGSVSESGYTPKYGETPKTWAPIGKDSDHPFSGTFDGSGYTISELYMSGSESYQGLFGYVTSSGVINNVKVSDSYFYCAINSVSHIGAVCGYLCGTATNCTTDSCYIYGKCDYRDYCYAGGIVGSASSSSKINNFSAAGGTISVTGSGDIGIAGGVIGRANGKVTGCSNMNAVTIDCVKSEYSSSSYYYAGGIVGQLIGSDAVLSGCKNTGIVSFANKNNGVGGIVGSVESNASVAGCTNSGSISGSGGSPGGITGSISSYGEVDRCLNTGTVSATGGANAGGIAGDLDEGYLSNCKNTAVVSSDNDAGGIAGEARWSKITSCVNLGSVSGTNSGKIYGDGDLFRALEWCYYQAESYADNNDGTYAATESQFESGEITYLLNGGETDGNQAWYQNIDNDSDVDTYPMLNGTHGIVYLGSHGEGYTNTAESTEHIYDANGFCTKDDCTSYYMPAQLSRGRYVIRNAGQLYWFAATVNGDSSANSDITKADPDIKGVLVADIDLGVTENTWTPIGTTDSPFTGTFNGFGFSVTLANTTSTADYQGLFGVVGGGAAIRRVITKGEVTGRRYVAGLVGGSSGTGEVTIARCGNEATVTAASDSDITGENAAGIFGCNVDSNTTITIKNCYNIGNITAVSESAAISGWLGKSATVKNCYNIGSVSGASSGYSFARFDTSYPATVKNCYQLSTIEAQSDITSETTENFASGAVAYALQSGVDSIDYTDETGDTGSIQFAFWGQTLTGEYIDAYPHLTSDDARKVYKVTFTVDDAEYAAKYTNTDGTVTLPENPTKDGYAFTGWTANESVFDASTAVTEDTKVTAEFTTAPTELFGTGETDSGVYSDNIQIGVIRFFQTYAGVAEEYGFVFVNGDGTATVQNGVDASVSGGIEGTQIKIDDGYYADLTDITNLDSYYYAQPYVTIAGKTYYANIISTKVATDVLIDMSEEEN